ncbi:YtxH domain-containing protein [Hymenobacter sp. CRA2]|uniref:YtxH domain-containing protein n=1 Tax=Hymenobacter sp. CRA2 TaxID=1955620 RepID=UPI00098EF2EA|nr:YtxH domain-containing protein [Hymenobacter sp. CRA2]OON68703.1 hypothetical protein B0919_10940 [Hymenobacter sp. CRA2]
MKDNSGKVLLALLAGASAGIVAGLLMAPEAGTATRETWGKSLGKFGDDLNKLLQDGLSKLDALKGGGGSGDEAGADRSGAEDALAGMGGGASGSAGSSSSGRGKSGGSKASNGGSAGGSSSGAGSSTSGSAGTSSGDAGASTASSSRTTGGGEAAAGGTTGGSGVGS